MTGIHAAESYREAPPAPRYRERHRNPNDPTGDSELSWGPGLVPRLANGRLPSEGGMYVPRCPRVELPPGRLAPREIKPDRNELRGHPGHKIAPPYYVPPPSARRRATANPTAALPPPLPPDPVGY